MTSRKHAFAVGDRVTAVGARQRLGHGNVTHLRGTTPMRSRPWYGAEDWYEVRFDTSTIHSISDRYLEPEHPLESLARCTSDDVKGSP